jgi:hypothetical protein
VFDVPALLLFPRHLQDSSLVERHLIGLYQIMLHFLFLGFLDPQCKISKRWLSPVTKAIHYSFRHGVLGKTLRASGLSCEGGAECAVFLRLSMSGDYFAIA